MGNPVQNKSAVVEYNCAVVRCVSVVVISHTGITDVRVGSSVQALSIMHLVAASHVGDLLMAIGISNPCGDKWSEVNSNIWSFHW